jgi:hypothetical protein
VWHRSRLFCVHTAVYMPLTSMPTIEGFCPYPPPLRPRANDAMLYRSMMIMKPPMLEVYRMLKLKKGVQQMIDEARQEIVNHTPEEAKRRVDEENALLVDVRDIRELQRDGVIPGAFHAPRGMLEFWIDPEFQYFKEVFAEDREFILF